jgi:antirestriction protein ArdC
MIQLGSMIQGHTLPLWLGAAQAKAANWWPKKGSTCCRILRPQANSYTETEQDPATGKEVDVTRAWTSYKAVAVFNAADFKGVDEAAELALQAAISSALGHNTTKPQAERLHLAEQVLEAWLVPTTYGGAVACYSPQLDQIRMPPPESFNDRESFVATWAHEQAHSTGHKARLNRPQHGSQGTKPYALEELVAELASVLICYRLQVGCCLTNHAAYLKQWAAILQAEPGSLFKILGKARAAADLITNTSTTATTAAEVLL